VARYSRQGPQICQQTARPGAPTYLAGAGSVQGVLEGLRSVARNSKKQQRPILMMRMVVLTCTTSRINP
jgi:hypothetical protein